MGEILAGGGQDGGTLFYVVRRRDVGSEPSCRRTAEHAERLSWQPDREIHDRLRRLRDDESILCCRCLVLWRIPLLIEFYKYQNQHTDNDEAKRRHQETAEASPRLPDGQPSLLRRTGMSRSAAMRTAIGLRTDFSRTVSALDQGHICLPANWNHWPAKKRVRYKSPN